MIQSEVSCKNCSRPCPQCNSKKIVKNGHTHYGKQRFKCNNCGRQFVESPTRQPISRSTGELIDKLLRLEDVVRCDCYFWRRVESYCTVLLNSLILTGDEINFGGTVSGNNLDLTIQPFSSNRAVNLGGSTNISNSLNLTNGELNWLQNGFNSLTIGSADTGDITIINNIIFNARLTISSGSGSIQGTDSTLTGADNATLTLEANQNIN